MNLVRKVVSILGSILLAALLMAALAPKAAHAIVASLVEVSNTVAAPAVTQGVPELASQLVMLSAQINISGGFATSGYFYQLSSTGAQSGSVFIVPSAQNFVLTSIQFAPYSGSGSSQLSLINAASGDFYEIWKVSLDSSAEFQYPSGMVFGPGTAPYIGFGTGGTANATFNVYAHGYLTPN